MLESKLESDAKKLAERSGWIVYKGHGRDGSPDKIFTMGTYVFFVEFKKPNRKGGQQENQKREQRLLEANGSHYYLCNNLDQFCEILVKEMRNAGK